VVPQEHPHHRPVFSRKKIAIAGQGASDGKVVVAAAGATLVAVREGCGRGVASSCDQHCVLQAVEGGCLFTHLDHDAMMCVCVQVPPDSKPWHVKPSILVVMRVENATERLQVCLGRGLSCACHVMSAVPHR